jgi:3'-phosphoadenosine 5'-phosphosulfate sulfotransferase (PAPS reductase)/FAD synthetase
MTGQDTIDEARQSSLPGIVRLTDQLGFTGGAQPKHVVGLSGGKDSTALALWLVENEPREYEFICNRTGNELPAMVAHWARLERVLGQPIKPVTHTVGLVELCKQKNMLPNFRMRWCTIILKIEPTIAYMESLPEGSTLYVGLRADEEMRRGIFGEDIAIRFPLREQGWNAADVWRYLEKMGVTIPARTDCGLCPYQRLEEWFDLWKNHPEEWAVGVALEARTGHTFRSDGRDTWPAGMKELGEAFASGRPLRKSSRSATCRVCSL